MAIMMINPFISFPETGGITDPTDISNILNWNDVSQLTGLSDGDGVETWTDYSGNGNDILRSSPTTARPTYKTNIQNSKPALLFDGTSDQMACSYGSTISQPLTYCMVINPDAGSDNIHDSSNSGRIATVETSGNVNLFAGSSVSSGLSYPSTASVLFSFYNGSSSYARLNGTDGTNPVNPGTNALGTVLRVGANDTFNGNWYKGYYFELIIYEKILNATEITDLENYLSNKWNITVS